MGNAPDPVPPGGRRRGPSREVLAVFAFLEANPSPRFGCRPLTVSHAPSCAGRAGGECDCTPAVSDLSPGEAPPWSARS